MLSEVSTTNKFYQWLRLGEWLLLVLLSLYVGVRILPRAWHTLNTDFPNYYLTARLVRERYDTSRIYEWIWIARQKDHRDIDQRVVGMVPITPFSTLIVYPVTSMSALSAKHCWILINLGLLFGTLCFLHNLTQLPWRRVLLVAGLSFPLYANFLLGQYYVLLLFLLVLACWLYLCKRSFLAGVVVGLAAGLKIFPVIYLVYFLRKRDARALAGGMAGCLSTAIVSVAVFGWTLHRTYLAQVLPAALRGEGLDPYNLIAASLSSLLHRLFIYEPQLNQHPAIDAPWLFAIFHPLLQMVILAPALLLSAPEDTCPRRLRLEWAAILLASLAISTSPASYLFTLLILPACFLLDALQEDKHHFWSLVLLAIYVAAGFVRGTNRAGQGWSVVMAVPRLWLLLLFCVFGYVLLAKQGLQKKFKVDRPAWTVALLVVVVLGIAANLRHQRRLYADYQWRVSTSPDVFMSVHPAVQKDTIVFVALLRDGYHLAREIANKPQFSAASSSDYLSVTAAGDEVWAERAGHESTIVSTRQGSVDAAEAESPIASPDGRWLAYLRSENGQASIWLRVLDRPDILERRLTPPGLNVLEMSFRPDGDLIFAANSGGHPSLFAVHQTGGIQPLNIDEARYPAVSPDGRWLAYSRLQGGNWNLWLRDLKSDQTRRLTDAACNFIDPTFTPDSGSLIYASDCGRGLWFTALSKRPMPRLIE